MGFLSLEQNRFLGYDATNDVVIVESASIWTEGSTFISNWSVTPFPSDSFFAATFAWPDKPNAPNFDQKFDLQVFTQSDATVYNMGNPPGPGPVMVRCVPRGAGCSSYPRHSSTLGTFFLGLPPNTLLSCYSVLTNILGEVCSDPRDIDLPAQNTYYNISRTDVATTQWARSSTDNTTIYAKSGAGIGDPIIIGIFEYPDGLLFGYAVLTGTTNDNTYLILDISNTSVTKELKMGSTLSDGFGVRFWPTAYQYYAIQTSLAGDLFLGVDGTGKVIAVSNASDAVGDWFITSDPSNTYVVGSRPYTPGSNTNYDVQVSMSIDPSSPNASEVFFRCVARDALCFSYPRYEKTNGSLLLGLTPNTQYSCFSVVKHPFGDVCSDPNFLDLPAQNSLYYTISRATSGTQWARSLTDNATIYSASGAGIGAGISVGMNDHPDSASFTGWAVLFGTTDDNSYLVMDLPDPTAGKEVQMGPAVANLAVRFWQTIGGYYAIQTSSMSGCLYLGVDGAGKVIAVSDVGSAVTDWVISPDPGYIAGAFPS